MMDKRTFLQRLSGARRAVAKEIEGNGASGNKYARGLASEGYAGGYRDALNDCDAVLRHGNPRDDRGYWRKSE